jgi:hypothetical protein
MSLLRFFRRDPTEGWPPCRAVPLQFDLARGALNGVPASRPARSTCGFPGAPCISSRLRRTAATSNAASAPLQWQDLGSESIDSVVIGATWMGFGFDAEDRLTFVDMEPRTAYEDIDR